MAFLNGYQTYANRHVGPSVLFESLFLLCLILQEMIEKFRRRYKMRKKNSTGENAGLPAAAAATTTTTTSYYYYIRFCLTSLFSGIIPG